MLRVLRGNDGLCEGIMLCMVNGNTSALPLHVHYIAMAVESNKKVVIVSSQLTEMNYRLICSKAGVRWVPSLISVIPPIESSCKFDVNIERCIFDMEEKILAHDPNFVLFDDLSIFDTLGIPDYEISISLNMMYTKLSEKKGPCFLLAAFCTPNDASEMVKPRSSSIVILSPVGHGFGKSATAKCSVRIRKDSHMTTICNILLSGERNNNGTITN